MKRNRFLGFAVAFMVLVAGGLMLASPAMADTIGPIMNNGNGLCFQPAGGSSLDGTAIVQEPCVQQLPSGSSIQRWTPFCADSGCTKTHFRNVGTGLCLSAEGNAPANGLPILLKVCRDVTDLNWRTHGLGSTASGLGFFTMESGLSGSTGFCLDVPGGSGAIGLALQLFRCNGTPAQTWQAQTIFE